MKQYEYGVFATGEDTPRLKTSVYQEARDFADGWNSSSFTNKRAEVRVRTVEISPWTLHHHEKILALRERLAATDAVLDTMRAQNKLDSKWYEV